MNGPLMVKALDTYTGFVAIGNDGSGMRLASRDPVVFNFVGNLASILVDAAVNGEGVAWLMLDL